MLTLTTHTHCTLKLTLLWCPTHLLVKEKSDLKAFVQYFTVSKELPRYNYTLICYDK